MLISHYRHLELEEGVPFGPALAARGAEALSLAQLAQKLLQRWPA